MSEVLSPVAVSALCRMSRLGRLAIRDAAIADELIRLHMAELSDGLMVPTDRGRRVAAKALEPAPPATTLPPTIS